ncbi:hypothetical protein SY27_07155 [Flavobacterium sp. 316]|uniref:MafI family immunity protein n=1 Tax=Flavobacterium sediminilitoris TaxID=2024526 RepID=A0ABY4HPM2_9FLAO|nr:MULTISPECIES: MafI family immunity protein [Flavobacterium]KIX21477.1 hypothetical protein SY27_07155 [Flavobacterium sp. 316]UOX34830.1 MafI family immunity protein [Flavobacterium sediminilitoris]
MFYNKKKKILEILLDRFSSLILSEDIINCKELLSNREYSLCYNTLVTQIYEYDQEITQEDYNLFESSAKKLNLDLSEYELLKELIRDR